MNRLSIVFLRRFSAAFPAVNLPDMLSSELGKVLWHSTRRAGLPWAVLNLLVLLVGLIVMVVGAKLFFRHWVPG